MSDTKQATPELGASRVEITLDFPVEMEGVQVGVVRMRRPKVRDQLNAQRQANNDPARTEVFLFALLCDIAPTSLEEMDIADYEKLRDTYAGFRAGLSLTNT